MHTLLTMKPLTLKQWISASVLALALPLANTAIAHEQTQDDKSASCQRGHHAHHHGFKHHGFKHHGFKHHGFKQHAQRDGVPHYLRGVDLTSEQKDQLFALHHEQAPALREQHKQRHALRQALREATHAPAFDDAKVQQIASGLANLEREQVLMRARSQAKIFALLTPEQREKAQSQKQSRAHGEHTGNRFHQRHEQGGEQPRKM